MHHFVLALGVLAVLAGCGKETPPATAGGSAAKADPAAKAEPKQAAPRHPWGSFKAGSYARLKSVSEMEIAGNKTKTETQMNYTLLEVTATDAVVEMEMISGGTAMPKNKMNMPLKGPEGKAAEGLKPKTGSETITVGGKSYKCTWTEVETEAGGNKTLTRSWMCEDVPGHLVKSVSKTTGSMSMSATTELVEAATK